MKGHNRQISNKTSIWIIKRCLLLPFASLPTTLLPLLLQPSLSSHSFRPLTSGSPLLHRPRPPLPSSLSLTLPPSVVSTLSPPLRHSFPTFLPPSQSFISVVLPAPPPSIHPVSLPPLRKTNALTKFFFVFHKVVGAGKKVDSFGRGHRTHTHTLTHGGWGGLCCVLLLISKNKSRGQRQEARSRARCYYSPMKNKQKK